MISLATRGARAQLPMPTRPVSVSTSHQPAVETERAHGVAAFEQDVAGVGAEVRLRRNDFAFPLENAGTDRFDFHEYRFLALPASCHCCRCADAARVSGCCAFDGATLASAKGLRIITYAYPAITWGDRKNGFQVDIGLSGQKQKIAAFGSSYRMYAIPVELPKAAMLILPLISSLLPPIRQAISNAWRIAPTFALPCPAISNAVPWAGVVIGIGKPPCTVTPRRSPSA